MKLGQRFEHRELPVDLMKVFASEGFAQATEGAT